MGRIDTASKEVRAKEERELLDQAVDKQKKKEKKKRNKMRGKGKIGREMENKTHQVHEHMREKNKLVYKREYERHKQEQETLVEDIGVLDKIGEKFDPLEAYFKGKKRVKREDDNE